MKLNDNLKIFELGEEKKYNSKKNSLEVIPRSSKTTNCEDWCEISIATVQPVISNIYFSHKGCLLSRACINAILFSIENQTKDKAIEIISSFRRMIKTSIPHERLPDRLKLFAKFAKFPSRRNCLLLGCNLIIEELNSRNCS